MNPTKFARGQTVEKHHVYVSREEDHQFRTRALETNWFAIRGCRTMGKTSLVVRNLDRLEEQGCRVIMVDVGGWAQPSIDEWLEELAAEILADLGDQEKLEARPDVAVEDLSGFLEAISRGPSHTLLVLDELDWLRELDYGRQALSVLKNAREKLARADSGTRLSICTITLDSLTSIGGASSAPIVTTIQMSDFPVAGPAGERVVGALAAGFPPETPSAKALAKEALTAAGGQPFQTMILASELVDRGALTLDDARDVIRAYTEDQRDRPRELFVQIEDMFTEEPLRAHEALNAYEYILQGHSESAPVGTPGAEFLLRAGLVRACDSRLAVKGPVFEQFFDRSWVRRTRDRLFDEQRRRKGRVAARREDRPRLCILNTGGTVGMVRRDGKVVEPRDEGEFLENFKELQEIAEIDFEQPFVKDSINVFPQQWTQIAETIYRKRHKGYTGFVVAHGTDTMAFTASAVAFALGRNLSFPVVFTGAQTTPEVLHGDSHANLIRACAVASKGDELPEVVISFGSKVFRAVRAQKRDELRFEAFESPSFPPLGEITESILLDRERVRKVEFLRKDLIRKRTVRGGDIQLQAEFASGVLMIQLTPGLEPWFYEKALGPVKARSDKGRCKGVILQTLGAGNVANQEPYSFTDFIRTAVRRDIPVVVTSPYPWSSDLAQGFSPAAEPAQLGAIIAGEMTAAAAATKFRWAIAQVENRITKGSFSVDQRIPRIREIMERNYLGEKDEESSHQTRQTQGRHQQNEESAA
jgi:L-asparaginase